MIGSGQEHEAGQAILEMTPTLLQGRVWDTTGRTTLPQLMTLLTKCRWTVGADPDHCDLATALGSRALGLCFAATVSTKRVPMGKAIGYINIQPRSSQTIGPSRRVLN